MQELLSRVELQDDSEDGAAAALSAFEALQVRFAAGETLGPEDRERYHRALIGWSYRVPEDDAAWLERFERSFAEVETVGGSTVVPWLAQSLARRLLRAGRPDDVTRVCDQACSELDASHPLYPVLAIFAADAQRFLGRPADAEQRLARVLEAEPEDGMRAEALGVRAQLLTGVGVLDRAFLDLQEATASAERWYEASRAAGSPDAEPLVKALLRRAMFQVPAGDFEGALEALDRIGQVASQAIDGATSSQVELTRGHALLERWRRERAAGRADSLDGLAPIEAAFGAALEGSDPASLTAPYACAGLAEACLFRDDVDGAAGWMAKTSAVTVDPDEESTIGTPRARLAGQLAVVRSRIAHRRGDQGEIERAHADLSRALDLLLTAWSEQPLRAGGIGFLHERAKRAVLVELCRTELAVRGRELGAQRALEHLLRARAMGTLARREGLPPVTAAELREDLLAAGEGLLLVLPGVASAYVLAVDRAGVALEEAASGQRLRELADRLRSDVGDAELELSLGRELSAALLPESIAERVASWSTVAVGGWNLLGGLWVERLTLPGGESLGRARALTRWPSAALVARSRGERFDREQPVACLLSPAASEQQRGRWPQLAPLPPPGHAAAELAERLGLPTGAVDEADAATLEALRAAGASAAVTVVLAHGVFEPSLERPAGLLLSQSPERSTGVISCTDVETSTVSPCVLLLACGAARGPRRLGDDGATHLGGAFLAAGSRAVVLADREVGHEVSLRFGEVFVRALARGESVAEAAREARDRLAREPGLESAQHWGAFQVLGDGAFRPFVDDARLAELLAPEREQGDARRVALLAGFGLVAAASVFAVRRRRTT